MKQGRIAQARQSLVDEHLRGAENDTAVRVVLQLLGRLIADPNRPLPSESRQIDGNRFIERIGRHDAVDRLQGLVPVDRDVGDVMDVFFHGLRRAERFSALMTKYASRNQQ